MFTDLDFSSVVSKIGLQASNVSRCPDQWVGDVMYSPDGFSYLGNSTNDFTWRENLSKASSYFKNKFSLLIILESPHVDEYKMNSDGSISAIGPANGQTGRSLRTVFRYGNRRNCKENKFQDSRKI
jgi:hypothetical protein